MENIRHLKVIREDTNSSLKIGVNLVNYTQSPEEIKLFREEMISKVDFVSVCEWRNELNHYTKPGFDMRSGQNRIAKQVRYCAFPLNTLVVLWNGDISFCQCAVTTKPPMLPFNAYTNNLKDIWKSPQLKETRNAGFKLGYPPYKECITCDYAKEMR